MKKIAIILRTNAWEYDPRLMKLALSLKESFNCWVSIFIMAVDNRTGSGITDYGIPYEYFARPELGRFGKKYESQIAEVLFFFLIRKKLKSFDIVWVEGVYTQYVALLTRKPVIWDLLELPLRYRYSYGKRLYWLLERKCISICHANQYRLEYLKQTGTVKIPGKHFVLRNYVETEWTSFDGSVPASYLRFAEWLNGDDYVYLQGLFSQKRYPYETLASVLKSEIPKIVVAGNVEQGAIARLKLEFPDWSRRVYLIGMIPHRELKWFTRGSKFSAIFYLFDHLNNRYCDPNRLYQCLSLGVPVIVGKNEPLSDFVTRDSFPGIVLQDDGRNVDQNVEAINQILNDYSIYKKRAMNYVDSFKWESQNNIIKQMLENLEGK